MYPAQPSDIFLGFGAMPFTFPRCDPTGNSTSVGIEEQSRLARSRARLCQSLAQHESAVLINQVCAAGDVLFITATPSNSHFTVSPKTQ